MLSDVHVMGLYWEEDSEQRSALGELVAAAKDLQDPDALVDLERRLGAFVSGLELSEDPLVLAVPPGPHRDAHPVPALAGAVARQLGAALGHALDRAHGTARLRDTPPERRREVVEAAGFSVTGEVTGRAVVLVDDVILTGTTVRYLAELLAAAGAGEISAVVACRTRRALGDR